MQGKVLAHHISRALADAAAFGGCRSSWGGLKDNDGGAEHNNTKEVPVWIDWIRPLWVVLLAWGVVLMTSFPVLVLIQFWGEQLEFRLGTALAIFLIMVAAGSAVLPAYIYLYVRSRNENAVIAAKRKHGCGSVSSDRCACDDLTCADPG